MNDQELRRYLLAAAKHGYADKANERTWTKQPDHSTTIQHAESPWSLHDNFFGGEPYGGREVVFYEDKPAWMMVYYGAVSPSVADVRGVYSCLQDALAQPDDQMPVRGPRSLEQGSRRYVATWEGNLGGFRGSERILEGNDEIYSATFVGGWVDARGE
jgi:hypothetical protein